MPPTDQNFLDLYKEYGSSLRNWFVAFGIGSVVFVLGRQDVVAVLKEEGVYFWSFGVLLVGVIVQIVVVFLNKMSNYLNYILAIENRDAKDKWEAFWSALSYHYWIDVLADIATIACFTIFLLFMGFTL